MPDFETKPWSTISAFFVEDVLPSLLIVLVALIALRAARLFVHGIVKALMDREATEGTAQELSAVELKKRMDTLDALATNVLQFFIVIIAGLMVLGRLGLDIGPAVAGLGVVGHRRRLRRAVPRARLPQRRPDPDREPVRPWATSCASPACRARSRTSRCAGRPCATSTASSTPSPTARSTWRPT